MVHFHIFCSLVQGKLIIDTSQSYILTLGENLLFIYFMFGWVFIAARGLVLVVESRGHSLVAEHALFIVVASLDTEHVLKACGLQYLRYIGLVVPRDVQSSRIRDWNRVPTLAGGLNHWTTREVHILTFKWVNKCICANIHVPNARLLIRNFSHSIWLEETLSHLTTTPPKEFENIMIPFFTLISQNFDIQSNLLDFILACVLFLNLIFYFTSLYMHILPRLL